MCCPAIFSHSTSLSCMPKALHSLLHMPVIEIQETEEGGGSNRKLKNRKVETAAIRTRYF